MSFGGGVLIRKVIERIQGRREERQGGSGAAVPPPQQGREQQRSAGPRRRRSGLATMYSRHATIEPSGAVRSTLGAGGGY